MGKLIVICALSFLIGEARAQEQEATPEKRGGVLDFEADVIEGEKKAPSLFLEFSMEGMNLESLIYMRKDFNDFHALESKRKLKYQPGIK